MLFLMLAAVVPPAATATTTHACAANTSNRQSVNPKIIVQGGIQPNTNPTNQLAIGPKQDDPVGPKPGASSGTSMIAIGPKQDDPAQPGRGVAASAKSDCGLGPAPVPAH
jgi:hypothetical protein